MLILRKKKGFTLVELLVVITIIALLLAVMIPALGEAKKIAQSVICRTYLHQWGLIFALYAHDNDGSMFMCVPAAARADFGSPWETALPYGGGGNTVQQLAYWMAATLPYYEDKNIRLCPTTKIDPVMSGGWHAPLATNDYGGIELAWGPFPEGERTDWWTIFDCGSYGINNWCADPPVPDGMRFWGLEAKNAWRKITASGGQKVPMFMDMVHMDNAPFAWDKPLPDELYEILLNNGEWYWYDHGLGTGWGSWDLRPIDSLQLSAIPRHRNKSNILFMDLSVESSGLREQWGYKWHKNFDVHNNKTQPGYKWPGWMRDK